MKKHILLLISAAWLFFPYCNAQEAVQEPTPWKRTAGLGFDFAQLLQINPRQGAGQNRLGLSGAINFSTSYKKDKIAWDNAGLWQFGIQRLGAGVISTGNTNKKIPFQKSIDELRFNTKVGFGLTEKNLTFFALDFSLLSQLTPTYLGNAQFPGNFLPELILSLLQNYPFFIRPSVESLSW